MFQLNDVERARQIVCQLNIPDNFGYDEDESETYFIELQLEDILGNNDFFVSCGVTKAVIVVNDLPFVIKIPFNGRWIEDCDDENSSRHFSHYYNANGLYDDDYCSNELEKTQDIQKEGYGCFVPDMMYLGYYCGRCIYIQEKVRPLCDYFDEIIVSEDSLKKARCSSFPFRVNWIGLVYDVYGEEKWEEFVNWADEWDTSILSDMHTGNYGIDMEGRPIIFDLSGFND